MTLRNGKEFLMIPGPTNVPEEVLRAMHRPAIDIYEGPLVETTDYCLARLKHLFRTEGKTYIYAANGHGAWDAALCNTLKRGDKILVLESGLFATGWGEAAGVMGLEAEILPGGYDRAVDPVALETRLKADTAYEIARHPGGADRYGLRRLERHCRSAQGDRRGRTPGPCSWSTQSRLSAACRSKWMPGASMCL